MSRMPHTLYKTGIIATALLAAPVAFAQESQPPVMAAPTHIQGEVRMAQPAQPGRPMPRFFYEARSAPAVDGAPVRIMASSSVTMPMRGEVKGDARVMKLGTTTGEFRGAVRVMQVGSTTGNASFMVAPGTFDPQGFPVPARPFDPRQPGTSTAEIHASSTLPRPVPPGFLKRVFSFFSSNHDNGQSSTTPPQERGERNGQGEMRIEFNGNASSTMPALRGPGEMGASTTPPAPPAVLHFIQNIWGRFFQR